MKKKINSQLKFLKKVSHLVDMILNQTQNKFHYIQDFLCFIVEINSELIRIFPEYAGLADDINLRFIVIARNVYNLAFEIYFALHDLYKISVTSFIEVFREKCPYPIDDNIIKIATFIYKSLNDQFASTNNNFTNNHITIVLENSLDKMFSFWEAAVVERGKELTRFYSV